MNVEMVKHEDIDVLVLFDVQLAQERRSESVVPHLSGEGC